MRVHEVSKRRGGGLSCLFVGGKRGKRDRCKMNDKPKWEREGSARVRRRRREYAYGHDLGDGGKEGREGRGKGERERGDSERGILVINNPLSLSLSPYNLLAS